MSNLASYSPYNKTYKFIVFQNQAYHEKNKRTAKPCIRTNLRYSSSSVNKNDSQNSSFYGTSIGFVKKFPTRSTQRCQSPLHSQTRSMLFTSQSKREQKPKLEQEKMVIHKNKSFQRFRNKRITKENNELVRRLIETDCQVIKKQKSEKSFKKHLKYSEIRSKFDSKGNRKHSLAMGNHNLLCPTLQDFNDSGLGNKFLETDLSMSHYSHHRKRKSNFS